MTKEICWTYTNGTIVEYALLIEKNNCLNTGVLTFLTNLSPPKRRLWQLFDQHYNRGELKIS